VAVANTAWPPLTEPSDQCFVTTGRPQMEGVVIGHPLLGVLISTVVPGDRGDYWGWRSASSKTFLKDAISGSPDVSVGRFQAPLRPTEWEARAAGRSAVGRLTRTIVADDQLDTGAEGKGGETQ